MPDSSLQSLAASLETLPDPRSKQGVSHPYHGMLALVLLGLIAQLPTVAEIRRWAKRQWHILKEPLKFKRKKPPVDTTLFRALEKTTVEDFYKAVAKFLKVILAEEGTLTAAVDGKVAKQMKDADNDPIQMLNIFIHDVKVTMISYDIGGDKTNEPGCLKSHLDELFKLYPMLRLLTGDAIFAQRPLLEVLKEHGCDYVFQIKANQPDILDAAKTCFAKVDPDHPDDQTVEKRGSMSKYARFGATRKMPNISASGLTYRVAR
jgi:hypothetical protein